MFLLSYFFAGAHDLWVNLKEVVLSVLLFSEKSANPRLKFVWWRICLLWKKRWGTTSFSKAFVECQASDTWKSFGRNSGTMKEERERECVYKDPAFALGHFALSFMAGIMTSKSYVTRAKWIYNFQMWSCWVCKCVFAFVVIKCRIPCSCCRTSHTIRMNKWFLTIVSNRGSKQWGWPIDRIS
jgi:hypothetical protein